MNKNAELWGAIYRKLQEIDENKKFRKTIDKIQKKDYNTCNL